MATEEHRAAECSNAEIAFFSCSESQALARDIIGITNVQCFTHERVELETMYATPDIKKSPFGWLAPAKRVAGSSDFNCNS